MTDTSRWTYTITKNGRYTYEVSVQFCGKPWPHFGGTTRSKYATTEAAAQRKAERYIDRMLREDQQEQARQARQAHGKTYSYPPRKPLDTQ